ncbi:NAD(P)/FAD-dependent oxidoreductase [Sedimentitalea sp. HM32M-2]|uniref:NAD(P)/FAD-dependent oxidoreductase n=1 Tax=Sedimentitalea sp. HM32M-2 TaxID=3351566 RepID=UPI0036380B4D
MQDRSVIVIGAGITGVAAAEWLRRDGWTVTLVDPVLPGDPAQASFGNAGLLARSALVPVSMPGLPLQVPLMLLDPNAPLFLRWGYLPRLMPWLVPFLRNATTRQARHAARALAVLTSDAVDQHQALAAGTPAAAHIRTGDYVYLYPARADYEKDALANRLRADNGFVPDLLDRAELLARDSHLGPHYRFGARFDGYGWLSSPAAYLTALYGHFLGAGGGFRQDEAVTVTPGPRPRVTLASGDILTGTKIVLAAGVWSDRLVRTMAMRVRLESERGYHLSMYDTGLTAPNPYMLTDAKVVITPMQGFLRAAGIVEFGGVTAPPSAAPAALIRRQVKRLYPGLTYARADSWMGRRPTTPDSLPVLGESVRAPNVLHAYGGQHVGVTIAAKLGRTIADLAAGRRGNLDLSPYSVDRF